MVRGSSEAAGLAVVAPDAVLVYPGQSPPPCPAEPHHHDRWPPRGAGPRGRRRSQIVGLGTPDQVESDRQARAAARAEHLQAKAEGFRAIAESDAQQATTAAQRLTTPQPILVGHHSEGAMRRHYDTVSRRSQAALDAETNAAEAEAAAGTAAAAQEHRSDPAYIGWQILKLEADIPGILRQLEGSARELNNGTIESTPAHHWAAEG
ncbi:DUF3560 domain-containing protein [Pseudarthrobacter sp. H2]|uniref:DUF3560 domain-containing protein n=1 Tax=Pseudarthrobacter sp. H2 TaxID=3418415 RepID=UPI003CF2EC95